ncbi:Protein kinase domain-containing protein [Mycena venus]|uniref:Protein kinase domain-containing protein n=1 Tax=Mycena venus TaxID=2733690 RepID=A0A8H6Y1D2_9AGAR|nr:Protein kinase domain-containing protein [Mycena venus]
MTAVMRITTRISAGGQLGVSQSALPRQIIAGRRVGSNIDSSGLAVPVRTPSENTDRAKWSQLNAFPDHPARRHSSSRAPEWENIRRGAWFDLHRNFLLHVLETVGLYDGPAREITQLSQQWAEWDLLTSLANYRSVAKILFRYLKDSPTLRGVTATNVSHQLSLDISAVVEKMNSLLSNSATYKHFLSCRGSVAQELLDLLQDLLNSSYESSSRPLLSKALLRLSSQSGLHPTCFTLFGLQKVGQQVAGGGFGDIWKGLVDGQTVAVKSMRQFMDDDVRASLKKLGREALIWRQLSHPNLLPFFGLYMLDNRLCLISPWMDNGDLKHFLHNAPFDIDRVSLIADVCMGLEYLHSKHVVHGDLKAANILVTPSGRACITDFGLSTIVDELSLQLTFSSQSNRAGTVRYQAPELLSNERSNHFGSDVYAFACVCYEILTGKVPFFEVSNDAAIIFKVIEGTRPSRLDAISPEDLWLLLEACWHQQTDRRPSPTQILRRLVGRPIRAKIKQSPSDWDDSYSARFRRSIQEWPLLPSIAEIEQRIPQIIVAAVAAAPFASITRVALDPADNAGQGGSRSVEWSGTQRDRFWDAEGQPSAPLMKLAPLPPATPFMDPSLLHPWLNGNDPSPVFHFDLASKAFAPMELITINPLHGRSLREAEFSEPAFHPPLSTLKLFHPRIQSWPINLVLPAGSLSLGYVLVSLHRAMHQRVTQEEWASLNTKQRRAITKAFTVRCRAEAIRSQVPPEDLRSQENDTRNEGVKRVDFLCGKTLFKGLVSEPNDIPGWMRVVTVEG